MRTLDLTKLPALQDTNPYEIPPSVICRRKQNHFTDSAHILLLRAKPWWRPKFDLTVRSPQFTFSNLGTRLFKGISFDKLGENIESQVTSPSRNLKLKNINGQMRKSKDTTDLLFIPRAPEIDGRKHSLPQSIRQLLDGLRRPWQFTKQYA